MSNRNDAAGEQRPRASINPRAWEVAQKTKNTRRYWDWRPMVENGRQVQFCGTPPISHFFGLEVSLDMLEEEGLEDVFVRHRRLADATRACVRHWGKGGGSLEIYPLDPEMPAPDLRPRSRVMHDAAQGLRARTQAIGQGNKALAVRAARW